MASLKPTSKPDRKYLGIIKDKLYDRIDEIESVETL
jgi:hypothetical protein